MICSKVDVEVESCLLRLPSPVRSTQISQRGLGHQRLERAETLFIGLAITASRMEFVSFAFK